MSDPTKIGSVVALPPAEVEIGWRARGDLGDIDALAQNIRELGQLQPGLVAHQPGKRKPYLLVAGGRRLEAAKRVQVPFQAVVISQSEEVRLLEAQMSENIHRKDFDPLELSEGLARWKRLYESAHPETVHGAQGRGRVSKTDTLLADRFTKVAASRMQCGETKVRELLEVAALPEKEKEEISKAPTSRQRAQKARQALSAVRRQNRVKRLEARAALAEASRKDSDTTVEPDPAVVVLEMDNGRWFASAEQESVDLFLTDPPFERDRSLIAFSSRKSISSNFGEWDRLDVGWLAKAAPLLADGGQILAFCPLEAIGEYEAVARAVGLQWHNAYVWHITNPAPAARPTTISACEGIVWVSKGSPSYFRPFENAGTSEAHNFLEGPLCGGSERLDHPTQKPLWIVDRLLLRHASSACRVVDPFTGVGTTAAACKLRNLRCTAVERDPHYAKQARLRVQQAVQ